MTNKKQSGRPIPVVTPLNNNSDVLELEATEENPLDKTITQELVKNNVTDKVIATLKEKYGELRLKDLDDKEGYLEIKEARKEVRKWGILTENLCKKGREDAIAIQRKWLAKEKEVLGKIAEVQDPLDSEMGKYEQEQERRELEAAQRREEAYMKRQQQLLKMGTSYEGGSFTLNHISYEATIVKDSDDDIWAETILPKYQREYEKNEAERVAIEKKREEEVLALKKQQAEMDRQRKELEDQQRQFREQQEQLKKEQDQAVKVIQDQKRQKLIARGNQLAALGMTFDFQKDAYVFQDISVDNKTEVGLWSDSDWDDLLNKIAPIIEDKKADLEIKRQAEIKQREQEAVDRAVAEEKENQRKLAEQIEVDKKRAEAQKAEEAEKATDKVKWQAFISHINNKPLPEMKNHTYKYKVSEASKLIDKINNL